MKKAKLVIFRHGQTEYNKNHLMTGQADVPLTLLGEEQAVQAGKLIAHLNIDKAYSSTLERAFLTAALALKAAGTQDHLRLKDGGFDIEQRVEIVEIHTGDFTGRNHKTDPEIVSWKRAYERPLPGGESDKMAVERVQKFFENDVLPRLHAGETVLVVVHAGIVRAFDIVLGVEDAPAGGFVSSRRSVPNATPTVYEYEGGKMTHFYTIENPKIPKAANDIKPLKPGKTG